MIGQDRPHDSALGHVTGESIFVDDTPTLSGEVFVGILTSPIACGELIGLDDSKAKSHPDYLGIISANEISYNKWGTIVHEQPLLVEKKIGYKDEALALVVSCSPYSLGELIKLIQVEVKEQAPITKISEAKDQISKPNPFIQGDVDAVFKNAPHLIEGSFICGGQEHFYMESNAAIAYPDELGQMRVLSSSQHPSETQRVIAHALGLPLHKVVCEVKRMGGGFGGKESQAAPIAAYAALAARKFNKSARCVLTKDEDMKITGKRHPFENDYKVAFDDNGKILALKAHLKSDGGAYVDLSPSILERAMFHLDGAYYLENCHIEGTCFRTNNHPNTAFRGFGGPQGNMTIESIMEEIAQHLGIDSYAVRRANIYEGERNKTPYNQVLENNMLPALFDDLYKSSDYQKRKKEIETFNKKQNGKLRGLSMTATKFGIAFTARFLNQANAKVNVHLDGTVQVSTGATEMGQGVNTKIAQIVAHAFGIPLEWVIVTKTSTEKNHNTSPTAASSGSDINGAAALMACEKIKARLAHLTLKELANEKMDANHEWESAEESLDDFDFEDKKIKCSKGEVDFCDMVSKAYMNRVSLGEYAHYKTPGLGFDIATAKGKAFNYYTQGTAVSEVEIDEYTGECKVIRTDILMDLGRPLNKGIDYGQVSGAFVQAQGWVTTENLFYGDNNELLSHSPTTYKIPNIQDTPRVFNIEFIENNDNDCNVHKSKAVGEPPFVLGISVWTAIKNALCYRGREVNLISPATNEIILKELTRFRDGAKFK